MRETEKRIKRYKARLPKVRERVVAALVLFVFAASMLAVSTFSWLTLSVAPEVTGISTTIAANGSLEIALANGTGLAPSASAVGDSTLPIANRNVTWGNLINLSDASYGLDNITLRPASLNYSSLATSPLYAATYGNDGRVQLLTSDFAYTVWNGNAFVALSGIDESQLNTIGGVKAISSVKYLSYDAGVDENLIVWLNMLHNDSDSVDKLFLIARNNFNSLSDSKNEDNTLGYGLDSVVGLIGTYFEGICYGNTSTQVCNSDDIWALYQIMLYLDSDVMDVAGEALMHMLEVYQLQAATFTYTSNGEQVTYTPYEFESVDDFCAKATTVLDAVNDHRVAYGKELNESAQYPEIEMASLSQFISDRKTLKSCIEAFEPYATAAYNGETVTWGEISATVNKLIDISTVTLNGKKISDWLSSLSANINGLLAILNGSASDNDAVIHNGLVWNIDAFLHNGVGISSDEIVVPVDKDAILHRAGSISFMLSSLSDPTLIKANLRTDALESYPKSTSAIDVSEADSIVSTKKIERAYVAQETYGLALDFWVRTNSPGSFLILEGEVLYDEVDVFADVEVADSEGKIELVEVQVFLADVTRREYAKNADGSAYDQNEYEDYVQEDVEVYSIDDVWYYLSSDSTVIVSSEDGSYSVTMSEPAPKKDKIVKGYNGANRIWDESELLVDDERYSTSQGLGSCYTFYADTPEEMAQSLELLSAMKIAFITSDGTLMAIAKLETDLYYAEYGKVTVPIVLDPMRSVDTGETLDDGETLYAIGALPQNTDTLVTALIFLDGSEIGNDKVLSSGDIEGQLNIQFGGYASPDAISNETLMGEYREISATVDESEFDGTEDKFEVNVTLNVNGSVPDTVEAYFIRKINSTQGTREQTPVTFSSADGGNTWTGSYEFLLPGEYVLRTLTVNGTPYTLQNAVTVSIKGFSVSGVTVGGSRTYYTANNSVSESFTITIGAGPGESYPSSVKGIFMGDNGVTITTNYSASEGGATWTGDVTFATSGTYTMQYVVVDGQYFEVSEVTREVYTGLYGRVWITKAEGETYEEREEFVSNASGITYLFYGTPHTFDVSAMIYDNSGNELDLDVNEITLYYTNGLSANLEWNETLGRYSDPDGFEVVASNVYDFNKIEINVGSATETINKVSHAPSIKAVPTQPVALYSVSGYGADRVVSDYALAISEDADQIPLMTLTYANASTGVMYGKFSRTYVDSNGNEVTRYYILPSTRTEGETVEIGGEDTVLTDFTFTLCREDSSGLALDGYWKLEGIKMHSVYDGETFYLLPEGATELPASYTTSYSADEIVTAFDNVTGYYDYYLESITDITSAEAFDAVRDNGTKLVVSVTASFANDLSKDFGKDSSGNVTAAFMTSHTVSGLNIDFLDFEGAPLVGAEISNVSLKFVYDNNSSATYGGYTRTDLSNATEGATVTVALNPDTNKAGHYTQSAGATLLFAGSYSTVLNYTVGSTTYYAGNETEQKDSKTEVDMPANAPKFTVSSVKPSVYISDITMDGAGAYSVDLNTTGSLADSSTYITQSSGCVTDYIYTCTTHKDHVYAANNTQYISKIEDEGKTAWIYFKCNHDDVVTYDGGTKNGNQGATYVGHTYSYDDGNGVPKATLTLTGIGNATNAKLTFAKSGGGDVIMITQYTADNYGGTYWGDYDTYGTSDYEWTGDGDCYRFIGVMDNGAGTNNSDTKTVAGTITASTLILTYDSVEYSVTIPTITINNPY